MTTPHVRKAMATEFAVHIINQATQLDKLTAMMGLIKALSATIALAVESLPENERPDKIKDFVKIVEESINELLISKKKH